MNIRCLNSKDLNIQGLFSLFKKTVNIENNTVILKSELVNENEIMRLDRFCKRVYGNYDYLDVLCKLNSIYNPYSIQLGDRLFYADINSVESLYRNEGKLNEVSKLFNKAKKQREDENRSKYLNERETVVKLPPTIVTDDNFNQVEFDGEKLRLKTNFGG